MEWPGPKGERPDLHGDMHACTISKIDAHCSSLVAGNMRKRTRVRTQARIVFMMMEIMSFGLVAIRVKETTMGRPVTDSHSYTFEFHRETKIVSASNGCTQVSILTFLHRAAGCMHGQSWRAVQQPRSRSFLCAH